MYEIIASIIFLILLIFFGFVAFVLFMYLASKIIEGNGK
jgi:hypothetical protein